jgi:hypothetical protein
VSPVRQSWRETPTAQAEGRKSARETVPHPQRAVGNQLESLAITVQVTDPGAAIHVVDDLALHQSAHTEMSACRITLSSGTRA